MSDESLKALKETIALYQPKIQRNIEIVTPQSLGQTELLHIATTKFKKLVPNVSRRAASSEDNTVARVHTAPTLLDCIIGHAGVFYYGMNVDTENKPKGEYLGGFYIHSIPFEYALKPTTRLVYDADLSNEHWLVSYSPQTREYPASSIGAFIICSVTVIPFTTGKKIYDLNIVVEVPVGASYRLDETTTLKDGYYRIIVREDGYKYTINQSKKISKKEYDEERTERASLLSFKEKINAW